MHTYADRPSQALKLIPPTNHNPSDSFQQSNDWLSLLNLVPGSHMSQTCIYVHLRHWKKAGVYFCIQILADNPIMAICSDLPPVRLGACKRVLAGGEGWYIKRWVRRLTVSRKKEAGKESLCICLSVYTQRR